MLPDGRGTLTGKLLFVDNAVDAASGTVRVKAQFDNKDQTLWPGAFVGVRLVVQTLKDALVVPLAAIVQNTAGKLVYVVDADQKASPRRVEVLWAAGTEAVVSGVQPGERVVVDGRQNLRPGARVAERSNAAASAASSVSPRRAGSVPQ